MSVIAFYKPYGVLTAFRDAEGRSTLRDFIPLRDVYPAGRLDYDSEGLLLLTDDGNLIHALTSPNHKVAKTYLVQVEGIMTPQALAALQRGVVVRGEKTRRCQAIIIPPPNLPPRSKPVSTHHPTTWLRLVLREGRKRQIRHMTAAVGYPTLRLVRVAVGNVTLDGLQPGKWRELKPEEIRQLKESKRPMRRV